jgi:hypothetical protein
MRSATSPRDQLHSACPRVSRIPLGHGEWMAACPPRVGSLSEWQLRQAASAFLATRGPRPAGSALLPAARSAFGDHLGAVVAHADHDGVIACYYEPSALHGSVAQSLSPVFSVPAGCRRLRIERVPAREMPYPGQSLILVADDRGIAIYVAADLITPQASAALPRVLAVAAAPPRILAAR